MGPALAARSVMHGPTPGRFGAVAASALFIVLGGCAVGPDYVRPTLPAADAYSEDPLPPDIGTPVQRLAPAVDLPERWWEWFGSPALDDLVRTGLANNPTTSAARAALRAAQENVRASEGAYYPTAGVGYSASRQKIADPLASPAASGASYYSLHTAQVTVSYAPDVFGGTRRAVESLQAQADAQRWENEAATLALSANLVNAAIQEATLRAQIDATRRIVAIQADLLERYRRLRVWGQVAELDLTQQEAALAAAEANLPPLEKQLALQRNLIKSLSGRAPGDPLAARFTLEALHLPETLPLTLPSVLVERRPDVRAAEAQVRAASAAVGVAVANRLPGVTLGVDAWGSAAYAIADLFKAGTGFWTLAGGITQPLFDAGTLQHREAAARAEVEQAAAQYRSTVLNAFQNVADALQAIDADARGLRAAQRAQDAAQRSLGIARRQLALGDVSPLAVLQSEETALQAAVNVAQAQGNRLADTVALFQALGGGRWKDAPVP